MPLLPNSPTPPPPPAEKPKRTLLPLLPLHEITSIDHVKNEHRESAWDKKKGGPESGWSQIRRVARFRTRANRRKVLSVLCTLLSPGVELSTCFMWLQMNFTVRSPRRLQAVFTEFWHDCVESSASGGNNL